MAKDTLKVTIHDATTGEITIQDMTAEEIAVIERDRLTTEAMQAEEAARKNAELSAKDKLKALGLSDEEIAALKS